MGYGNKRAARLTWALPVLVSEEHSDSRCAHVGRCCRGAHLTQLDDGQVVRLLKVLDPLVGLALRVTAGKARLGHEMCAGMSCVQ